MKASCLGYRHSSTIESFVPFKVMERVDTAQSFESHVQ